MKAKPVVKTLTDTPLEVVAKTNADTITSMHSQALVKTEGNAYKTEGLHFCRKTD